MNLPPGYIAEPARMDDLDEYVALFEAWDLADCGRIDPVRESLAADLSSSASDLQRDTAVVRDPGRHVAAMTQVSAIDPASSIDLFARVHPAHQGRGLGAAALAWMEDRAVERIPGGAVPALYNATSDTDRAGVALLAAHGYRHARTFQHLEGDLSGAAPPRDPDGISIRGFRPGLDDRAFYDTLEDAFRGHFDWQTQPYEDWRHDVLEGAGFDPSLCFLASDGDDTAGVVHGMVTGDEGYVQDVGVRRGHRGRGVGEALLRTVFSAFAARGLARVALNVDAGNETGATRLYERVGMRPRRTWLVHEKHLPAG